jgi:hypothetical protein
MFINPTDQGLSVDETLRMGGRKTMARVDGASVHVTSVTIVEFDGEPPTYQVHHVTFVEPIKGQKMVVGQSTSFHNDIDDALATMVYVHNNPPEDVR